MWRKYAFIFETLVGFAILVAIDMAFLQNSAVYHQVHPHPYWIVIALIASRYGTVPGLFAGGIAALIYISIGATSGVIDFSNDTFPRGMFKYPFLFLLVGGVLGEIRSMYKKKYQKLERKHKEVCYDLKDLGFLHGALKESKQELEKRVAYQSSTMLNLIERFNKMETLKLSELYPQTLEMLEEHLNVTCASIYLIENNRLQLCTRRGNSEHTTLPDTVELTYGMMGEVVTGKRTVTLNRTNFSASESTNNLSQFTSTDLLMCAPITRKDGSVLGVINIESLPFFDFTFNSIKIFETISHWISIVIDKSMQFERLKDRNIDDEITGAFNYLYFQKRLDYEVVRAKRFNTPLALMLLKVNKFDEMDQAERNNVLVVLNWLYTHLLRQTDIVSKYKDDDSFAIILPCQTGVDADKIIARVVGEIDNYKLKPFEGSEDLLDLKFGMSVLQRSDGSSESMIQAAEVRLNGLDKQRQADVFSDIQYLLGSDESRVQSV